MDKESSGYFLAPKGKLTSGLPIVSAAEGARVWGRAHWCGGEVTATRNSDVKAGGDKCEGQQGMARYSFHAMLSSLNIEDTPFTYSPPRGPSIDFTVTYNQREFGQPANPNFSNLGPNWTFNWLSYVTEETSPLEIVTVYVRGGGTEEYIGFTTNDEGQTYSSMPQSQDGRDSYPAGGWQLPPEPVGWKRRSF